MKKNIIFFSNNDEIFTLPIILFLIKNLNSRFNIFIKFDKTSFVKKIKILLILILEGSIIHLFKYYFQKVSINEIINQKNVKLINNVDQKIFEYGFSINYPKKITFKKYKIFNFHIGNFENQRGTFIFFYSKIKKWKFINITVHQIDGKFDNGPNILTKKINIKNKTCLEIIAQPLINKKFYLNAIENINNLKKIEITTKGKLNREPSFVNIFFSKFKYF